MRIVAGIQPSGNLHIGNYIGAIKQFVQLQDEHECFFFLADLHTLTEFPEPEVLRQQVLQTAIEYIALGLDPQKVVLFQQSDVPAHVEAMWLLTTITPIGELERMTQYKDKASMMKKKAFVNAGLLMYPVLMAADILLYRPQGVPVGEDQKQHLELARNLAQRFNERFGEFFPKPEPVLPRFGARVMSFTDPTKKMSKSYGSETVLGIFDEPEAIRKKVKKAVTDSGKTVAYDPKKKPALANLLTVYAAFAGETPQESGKRFANSGYAEFKKALAELLVAKLAPFREKRTTLMQSPAHMRAVLEQGADRARAVSQETLREMRHRMGVD